MEYEELTARQLQSRVRRIQDKEDGQACKVRIATNKDAHEKDMLKTPDRWITRGLLHRTKSTDQIADQVSDPSVY